MASLADRRRAPAPSRGWRERWIALRNALLSSPGFQKWAGDFPLTRAVAQRRARETCDVVMGFVYTQTATACVELGLLELLREAPLTPAALAGRTAMPLEGMERLLTAAASLKIAEALPDGRYALGALGAGMLANPAIAVIVRHNRLLYADIGDPVALLRGEAPQGRLRSYWAYVDAPDGAQLSGDQVAAYSALMAQSQAFVADEVLDAYPVAGHRALLDVGGGEGVFLSAAAARAPGLRLMLFDLPAVAARAAARFDAAGLSPRAQVFSGSFLHDPLPRGADALSLIRVLHDHDDAAAMALLRAARAALAPGARILIGEPMAGTPGAEPIGAAYFGFYLRAMGQGRARTPREIAGMLAAAGFSGAAMRRTRTPINARLMVATAAP